MIGLLLRKLLRMIAVLVGAVLIMFLLVHAITGNPWGNYSTSQRRMFQGIGVVGIGATPRRIIFRHLLPNVLHLILVWIINTVPAVILLEAVLGYVGVALTNRTGGDEFTVVSCGGLFFSGRSAMSRNPLMLILPSLCILLISMSFVLLADYLNGITRQEE